MQIGIKSDWRGIQGRLVLFLGNKHNASLTNVRAVVLPPPHLRFKSSPVPDTIPPRAQVRLSCDIFVVQRLQKWNQNALLLLWLDIPPGYCFFVTTEPCYRRPTGIDANCYVYYRSNVPSMFFVCAPAERQRFWNFLTITAIFLYVFHLLLSG